jgi:hypothetical protein
MASFFTMEPKKRGLYFFALKLIYIDDILSSSSSLFSSRRFNMAI